MARQSTYWRGPYCTWTCRLTRAGACMVGSGRRPITDHAGVGDAQGDTEGGRELGETFMPVQVYRAGQSTLARREVAATVRVVTSNISLNDTEASCVAASPLPDQWPLRVGVNRTSRRGNHTLMQRLTQETAPTHTDNASARSSRSSGGAELLAEDPSASGRMRVVCDDAYASAPRLREFTKRRSPNSAIVGRHLSLSRLGN